MSFYSRTNNTSLYDLGHSWDGQTSLIYLLSRYSDGKSYFRLNSQNAGGTESSQTLTDSLGLFTVNRNSASSQDLFKNSTKYSSNFNSYGTVSTNILLGTLYVNGSYYYGARQCAFASIGDGLTDLESNLFYQIVEKYQYALGRNVNPNQSFYYNRNYTNETNAFIFNGAISDATQISAVNTLVTTLKTAGIWTKMKAVYPMVGGTALAHKFNLVNPIDSTSAYALTFNGGWTHSSTGALPNGTTAYADTFLAPSTALSLNSTHLSFYSRTNGAGGSGGWDSGSNGLMIYSDTSELGIRANDSTYTFKNPIGNTSKGLFIANRISSTTKKLIQNTNISNYSINSTTLSDKITYLGAINANGTTTVYDNKQCAFASIGDGLTDAEASSFYTAVQTYQTTLGRQV